VAVTIEEWDLIVAEIPLTQLLQRWSAGDEEAETELLPIVYDELHRIAERIFRDERSGHTLQTTAVIHEAYLNLSGGAQVDWQSRRHFYGVMARVMRRVLVDHARQRSRLKRGGDMQRVMLDRGIDAEFSRTEGGDVLDLDLALKGLEKLDAEKARMVELRFFGGLSLEEVAEVMDTSRTTIVRQWRLAKAWLYRELSGEQTRDL
jgi:RNA polymerase sigma factor (TIGR02999 family)